MLIAYFNRKFSRHIKLKYCKDTNVHLNVWLIEVTHSMKEHTVHLNGC